MGLFSFVKSVGKKLGIGGDDTPPSADELKKQLDSFDLGSEGLEIEIDGDTAVIKGEVSDQSIFEKAVVAVGNTLGISNVKTDDIKVGGIAPTDVVLHEVKKGDNLWKIAEAAYGKGKGPKYTVIFEANKPMLSHPDKIYPGQMLRIPPLD